MRINEINTSKTLTEAPLGFFSKMGNKAAAWAGDKMGADFGARASGKLETGQLANQLHKAFQFYLGQTGSQPTARAVLTFLQSKGYPTKNAKTILNKAAQAAASAASKFKAPKSPAPSTSSGTASDLAGAVSEGVNDPMPQQAIDQAFLAAAQEAIMMKAQGVTGKKSSGSTSSSTTTGTTSASTSGAAIAAKDDVVGLIKTITDPMALHYIASAAQKRIKELSAETATVAESKKSKK
jgi:multisubunit Na+/H+ antiporter MnhG subunit